MLSAAYRIYSTAISVSTSVQNVSDFGKWVHEALRLSRNDLEKLNPAVRRRLEWLARRLSVINNPLSFAVLWSQTHGSAVSEIVYQTKDVVQQVYSFLGECSREPARLKDKEYMVSHLDMYLHEIDFCIQSLTLAMSVIKASSKSESSSKQISPSSLLCASERLKSMHNLNGDVCVCVGSLYKRNSKNEWITVYPQCMYKITRNLNRCVYEIKIENLSCVQFMNDGGCSPTVMMDPEIVEHENYFVWDLNECLQLNYCSSMVFKDFPNMHKNEQLLSLNCFTWVNMFANEIQSRFLFLIGGENEEESWMGGRVGLENCRANLHDTMSRVAPAEGGDFFSPLTIYYISRLCMYENLAPDIKNRTRRESAEHVNISLEKDNSPSIFENVPLAHLKATDEELHQLLLEEFPIEDGPSTEI